MQKRGEQTGRKRGVQAAAEVVVRPLVRSFLRAGLKPATLRRVFESAVADCRERPRSPALASQRQDLADLAHVLSIWHTDPTFVDATGRPRPLRLKGRSPSFEVLAKAASSSAPADEILKKLLIAGAVDIDAKGRVRALRREFLSNRWDEFGLWSWEQTVRRLLETLEFNYTVPGLGRFERSARSERIPARLLPVFNRWARQHGEEFLRMADDWLTQHEGQVEDTRAEDTVTTGLGVYLFVDEQDGAEA